MPVSSSADVSRLLSIKTGPLQKKILTVLENSGQKSMSRENLLGAVAKAYGVSQLRGAMRAQFRKNMNAAIGVLLRPPGQKLVRVGTTNSAVALADSRRRPQPTPRAKLLKAVGARITLIRFTCVSCGTENEVRDLDTEGWCDCLVSYYATASSVSGL